MFGLKADGDNNAPFFEDKEVELPNLEMNNGPVIVNLNECMSFLTRNANPYKMRESHLIKPQWPLLKEIAESDSVINIYEHKKDGMRYKPVYNIVHQQIAIHGHQQQGTESYVKAIADQARTNVSEERRIARLLMHSYFKRQANKSALFAPGLKEGVRQVKSAVGTGNFLDEAERLVEKIQSAAQRFGKEKVGVIQKKFKSQKGSQGHKERVKKADKIINGLKDMSFQMTCKDEMPKSVEITASMGGGVPWNELTKTKGRLPEIHAEFLERNLYNEATIRDVGINELKAALKADELDRRNKENTLANPNLAVPLTLKDITFIKPISDAMRTLLCVLGEVEEEEEEL
jgi:hypothetical protein